MKEGTLLVVVCTLLCSTSDPRLQRSKMQLGSLQYLVMVTEVTTEKKILASLTALLCRTADISYESALAVLDFCCTSKSCTHVAKKSSLNIGLCVPKLLGYLLKTA